MAVTLCKRSISSLEMSENLLRIVNKVLSNFFLVGSGTRIDVAHEKCGGDAAGEICLIGRQPDNEGDDVIIDVVVGIEIE